MTGPGFDWQQALAIARQTPDVARDAPGTIQRSASDARGRCEIVGRSGHRARLNRVVRSIGAGRYLRLDDRGATDWPGWPTGCASASMMSCS